MKLSDMTEAQIKEHIKRGLNTFTVNTGYVRRIGCYFLEDFIEMIKPYKNVRKMFFNSTFTTREEAEEDLKK